MTPAPAFLGRIRGLSPRRVTTRALLIDVALTALLLLVVYRGTVHAQVGQLDERQAIDGWGYLAATVAVLPLAVRRIWPLPAFAVTVLATSAYLGLSYPYGPVLLPLLIGMLTVAWLLPVRRSLLAYGLAALAMVVPEVLFTDHARTLTGAAQLVTSTAWLLVPWAIGTVVRTRRDSARAAAEEEAERRTYEERLRIAHEVHDIVGHALSVITVQSGVALHVLDRRPDQSRASLEAIRSTSKDALDELRATLTVFRERGPAPGLAQLDTLVARMAESGFEVEVTVVGTGEDLPATVDLAAYRVVQESLTNVLRHAATTRAEVHVTHEPGELVVEVTDEGAARPAHSSAPSTATAAESDGHGIAGMRERAAALSGSLVAEPRPHGGFVVRARFPTSRKAGS